MSITADTRLLDWFDLPEPIIHAAIRRGIRTVGALFTCVDDQADVFQSSYNLFSDWLFFRFDDLARSGAEVIVEAFHQLHDVVPHE